MTPPILLEVPQELPTRRLLLRVPQPGDGRAVHEAVVESLQDLRAWSASLPWAMAEPTVEASETFCRESAAHFIQRRMLAYLAFERDTGRFVASTSLHRIDWAVPRFEVGFWCRSSAHRRGYAREAVGSLLELAFERLGARRVEALTDELNAACRSLCIGLGMQLEGILRNERVGAGGELRNTCLYAAVR